MSRDERRATIIDATIPLLIERGAAVNSKQIAEAAGVAVGTIYSVFADKDELIRECVLRHFDPKRAAKELEVLRERTSLPSLVEGMIEATQARAAGSFALISLLDGRLESGAARERPDERLIQKTCTDLLSVFADELRVSASRAAQAIRSAAFALSSPVLAGGAALSVPEIRDLVLHGVADGTSAAGEDESAC